MKNTNIKRFKDKINKETIIELIKVNNGYITSKQITDLGIHRMYLKILTDKKVIEK